MLSSKLGLSNISILWFESEFIVVEKQFQRISTLNVVFTRDVIISHSSGKETKKTKEIFVNYQPVKQTVFISTLLLIIYQKCCVNILWKHKFQPHNIAALSALRYLLRNITIFDFLHIIQSWSNRSTHTVTVNTKDLHKRHKLMYNPNI